MTGAVELLPQLVGETDRLAIKQELYNGYSSEYEERTSEAVWVYQPDYDLFASLVSGTVLDLGCGPGRDAAQLQQRGLHVLGVDFARFALRRAGNKGIETRELNYETDLHVFPSACFDGIWTNCSLTTTPRHKILLIIADLKRILKPAGVLFFGFIEGPQYQEGWIKPDKKYALPRYRFRDTRFGLRAMVDSTGLRVVHTRVIPQTVAIKNTFVNIYAINTNAA
jgi:SAM-dependent methyltransferase